MTQFLNNSERHPLCNKAEHVFTRRQLLGGSAAGLIGLGGLGGLVNPLFAKEMKSKEKQVLFIWIDGGMSQLESWDPKPNTQFGGPFRSIPTTIPGIHVSEERCLRHPRSCINWRSIEVSVPLTILTLRESSN